MVVSGCWSGWLVSLSPETRGDTMATTSGIAVGDPVEVKRGTMRREQTEG